MVIELDYYILAVFDRRYELSELQSAAKAKPGTYAHELINRLHHCIFVRPRDLITEYNDYYAMEYSSLARFLYWRYKIDAKLAKTIEESASRRIYVGYGRDTISLFGDETAKSILQRIFSELGDTWNEDSH